MKQSRRKLLTATGSVIGSSTLLAKGTDAARSLENDDRNIIDVQVVNKIENPPSGDWTLNHIEVCPPRPDIRSNQTSSRPTNQGGRETGAANRPILAPSVFYRKDTVIITDVNDLNSVRNVVYLDESSQTPELNLSSPAPGTLSIEVPDTAPSTKAKGRTRELTVPNGGQTEVPLYDREVTVRATRQTDQLKRIPNVPEWRRPYETQEKVLSLPVTTAAVVRARNTDTVKLQS